MAANPPTTPAARPSGADDHFWLGNQLVKDGDMTNEQLRSAIEEFRKDSRDGFSATLIKLGLIGSQRAAELIAKRAGLPLIHLDALSVPRAVARRLPMAKAKLRVAVPFKADGGSLYVAVADDAQYPLATVKMDFPDTRVVLHIAAREDILGAVTHAWTGNTQVTNPVEYFRDLVRRGIARNASDIHIDQGEEYARIRFRIDGKLVHEAYITHDEAVNVVRASKIEAKIDQHETRKPQGGGFTMEIGSKEYSFRVETMPCYFGENSVTRIQADNAAVLTYDQLGLTGDDQKALAPLLQIPNGIVLVTGPTGSGKSTLLNSMMHQLDSTEEKICTVEDPIEFPNANFSQVMVLPSVERTFANVLRSFLRQDPDVLLVGEIRDKETAEVATRAALTGHLVFSTLHTNTAAAAITRLIDIGIEPFLVASVIRATIAARLLRKLCVHCRKVHPDSAVLAKKYQIEGTIYTNAAHGCPECNHTGYRGRVGAFEILPLYEVGESGESFNEFVRHTITNHPGHEAEKLIVERLRDRGRQSLLRDGLSKVAAGITTLEEVFTNS